MGAVLRMTVGGKTVTHDLERLRANGLNMRPALERVLQVQTDAVRDQFDTEGQHYGRKWAGLSPKYKVRKDRERPGRKILVYSGKLKRTAAPHLASQAGVYRVTGKRGEVGLTDAQVPYAKYHQSGTNKMPARPFMGDPTRKDQKAMVKEVHRWLVNGLEVLR